MSNKIIDGLLSGNLVKTGKVSFNANTPCYFVEFQSGKIGMYVQSGRGINAYTEISIENSSVKTSLPRNPDFPVGTNINTLFDAIFNLNGKIASEAADKLDTLDTVDPNFVIALHWYNPRGAERIETVDLEKWAISAVNKQKLAAATTYFDKVNKKQTLAAELTALVAQLSAWLRTLIETNQQTGSNTWTQSGMLALNVQEGLEQQAAILQSFTDLSKKISDNGQTAPSFNDIIVQALASTDWTLARTVDFGVSPFVYLYPKTNGSQQVLPAVAPTDPSVKTG